MKRGVVVNNQYMKLLEDNSVSITVGLKKSDLNYFLLYYDRVSIPTNNIIHTVVPNETELIENGLIERPKVMFNNWSVDSENGPSFDIGVVSQSAVANDLMVKDLTTDWVLHQLGEDIAISENEKMKFNSIKLSLLNCLPVPNEDVQVGEIVKFKSKYSDELELLQKTIDNLYFEILSSPDVNFSSRKSINELKTSIADLNKAFKSHFRLLHNFDLKVNFNIDTKSMFKGFKDGSIIKFFSGSDLPIELLSGLMGLIGLNIDSTFSVGNASNKRKLNYLAKANKKNIINLR